MEVYDNLVSILQELLGLACPFGPSPPSFRDVLLHFGNTPIGAGCWKALGLDAHDLRIKILGERQSDFCVVTNKFGNAASFAVRDS